MKKRIIEINELSDSRELMESKEAPGIRWCIFILFILVVVFLLFSNFFYLDEYSKEGFEIKTDSVESIITISSTCKISKVNVHEGDYVNTGEVLYELDVEYAKSQKIIIEGEIEKKQSEIEKLKLLKESIEKDTNLFQNNAEDSEYYYKYEQYKNEVLLTKDNIDNTQKSNNATYAEKSNNIESNRENISKNEQLIDEYKVLLECVVNDTTYEGSDSSIDSYYQSYKSEYDKGISSVNSAEVNYNNYKSLYEEQCQQNIITPSQVQDAEMEKDTAYGNMNIYKESFIAKINGIIESLNSETDDELITEYSKMIDKVKLDEEYISTNQQIQNEYDSYLAEYFKYKEIYIDKNNTYNQIFDEYTNQSSQTNISKEDVDKYEGIYNDAKSDLEIIKSTMIYEIESKIKSLQSEDDALYNSIDSLNFQISGIKDYENNGKLTVEKIKNDSIIQIENEINTIENSLPSYKSQLKDIEKTISDSQICASCSGTITLLSEICEGDIIQSGMKLCSITPSDEDLKAYIYVYEKDIPKIEVGQRVEYSLNALPIEEYGVINGTINKVSADTIIDERSGIRYYIAEADFDKTVCNNTYGDERRLKNGMLGEVRIISGKKTILTWILEKLNFVD